MLVVVLVALAAGCGGSASPAPTSHVSARENVTFFYQPINAHTDLSPLGRVRIVVAGSANGKETVAAIHRTGAKAYRYVETAWFPSTRSYGGIDIAAHPAWAFCRDGDTPLNGKTSADGGVWWYADTNQRSLHQKLAAKLAQLRAMGWDGVFFDRGYASLTGNSADDPDIWRQTSTCSRHPITPGATFSDAYVDMARTVRKSGLELMVNYGVSPFDPSTPMRPDPTDEACVQRAAGCRTLDDVWKVANWTLDEAVAHPRDTAWADDFAANKANEQDPHHGGQVVGLITQGTLGGSVTRDSVYFEWARVKLFRIPVAIGTGNDGCPGVATESICNRQASYPELANAALGTPIDRDPRSGHCETGSSIACVWYRRYTTGASVVNVSAHPKRIDLPLGGNGCRYVFDLWSRRPLAGNQCVKTVVLHLPPWSGRPLLISTDPH